MFLKRIVLENVRSIESLDLPVLTEDGETRKWTFLLGENGTGKSTVLKAAALVLAGSDALSELLIDPDGWIRQGCDEAKIRAELVTAEGEEREVGLHLIRNTSLLELFERNRESLRRLDGALRHSMRNYLTLGYGVSRRMTDPRFGTSRSSGPFNKPRARSVATLFSADAELSPLQSWAIDLHYRRGDEGLQLIAKTFHELLPGIDFEGVDRERQELLFRTPDGILPLRQLSDGYQHMAAWCGDLLYSITQIFGDYDDPLAARGLLLIDEIDLHLHPVWQRQLKRFLSQTLPRFQILATTHSPLTAHQAGQGELFFLRREEGAPILHPYQGSPRRLMLHQLLVSPIFGLATMDSELVEEMRRRYDELKGGPSRTDREEREMSELADALSDLPDFRAHTELDRERVAVLQEIAQALETR